MSAVSNNSDQPENTIWNHATSALPIPCFIIPKTFIPAQNEIHGISQKFGLELSILLIKQQSCMKNVHYYSDITTKKSNDVRKILTRNQIMDLQQITHVGKNVIWNGNFYTYALGDFAPFVPFKKREKHSWSSVTFNKVAG